VIDGGGTDEERVLEIALENGAEDIRTEEGIYEVICPPASFETVRDSFTSAGIGVQLAEISRYPKTIVKLDRAHAVKVLKLVGALEDNDDVQRVSANFDISDDVLRDIEESV
jgi:transcriptional/translational regulatory protein YebC/TACO1